MAIRAYQSNIFYASSTARVQFCNRLFMMGFDEPFSVFAICFCETKATHFTF